MDGYESQISSNGTWISLQDFRYKKDRIETDQFVIKHGDEIKVSDSILKLEEVNNNTNNKN